MGPLQIIGYSTQKTLPSLRFAASGAGLQFLGVDPAYTYIAQGLVIIIAVALDLRKYLAKK